MNGAESLLRTLINNDITTCFTNPGTSEMQFVAAADRVPDMHCVLCLAEGVASGAADGYSRMSDNLPATLFHLGPGLANGLANLHNAVRAGAPIVNIVGDHATSHKQYDAPLASDVAAYAKPVSAWIKESTTAADLPGAAVAAITAARQPPGHVATLIIPADCSWDPCPVEPGQKAPRPVRDKVADEAVQHVAAALRSGEPTALLLGDLALLEAGSKLASALGRHVNARLFSHTFTARITRGAGRPNIERLPYFPEAIMETLTGLRHLVLVGAKSPVGFFAYPDLPSYLVPEGCQVHQLAAVGDDVLNALTRVADELGASRVAPTLMPLAKPALPTGVLSPENIALSVAALLPEHAVVAEEAISSGGSLIPVSATAEPHDWLFTTGGAIGQGSPNATGAALACPQRKVLCLQADGSGMYSLQALWTQAREALNVTTVVLANRKYRILNIEYQRVGAGAPGARARAMMDIDNPVIDWVKLANGMGVPACRVTTAEELNRQLAAYLAEPGPNLIEAVL
ncbi:MAG: acetolactate synthase large subunit [Gammaproteobacteria bacterium]|nr:acetolactate synthase large subunit [Gammaproteobacteria bacterium]